MANPTDILVENLREALKRAHTYLMTGYGAALFLLLLATQGKLAPGAKEKDLNIPYVALSAPTLAAALVALAICILSGCLVFSFFQHGIYIAKQFTDSDSKLRDAVLTYPSLLILRSWISGLVALGPGILLTCALTVAFYSARGFWGAVITGAICSLPYLLLAWRVWRRPLTQDRDEPPAS
jgi:hypothetical protein